MLYTNFILHVIQRTFVQNLWYWYYIFNILKTELFSFSRVIHNNKEVFTIVIRKNSMKLSLQLLFEILRLLIFFT